MFTATNAITTPTVGGEATADYFKIRKFDNGTVWWALFICDTDGTVDPTIGDKLCTNTVTFTPLVKATQIAWYETLLAGTPGQSRTVYYVNGTVTQETWTWDNTKTPVRSQTVTKVLIAKPAFVDYTPLLYTDSSVTVATMYPWSAFQASPSMLIERRTYKTATNNTVYYYFKRVEDDIALITDQAKKTALNIGEYIYEDYTDTTVCPDVATLTT